MCKESYLTKCSFRLSRNTMDDMAYGCANPTLANQFYFHCTICIPHQECNGRWSTFFLTKFKSLL